jgi:hypothetical protein
MKLRIRGNSLRLRVNQSETAQLAAGKKVEQVTEFSTSDRLVSSVEASPNITSATAQFSTGCITVLLPLVQVNHWANSDAVSIETSQPIASDRSLHILVEKDFECLHSKNEEDADAFPNLRR